MWESMISNDINNECMDVQHVRHDIKWSELRLQNMIKWEWKTQPFQ